MIDGGSPILTLYNSISKYCKFLLRMETELSILSNSSNEEILFFHRDHLSDCLIVFYDTSTLKDNY